MKDLKAETPPLTRAGRKEADAALEAAKFRPTIDGQRSVRQFEVHGMTVTEYVSARDVLPATSPSDTLGCPKPITNNAPSKEPKPETPPLTRAGRKVADATLAAAKFQPTSDGKRVARQYVVHGMAVTEFVDAEKASKAGEGKK